MDQQKLNPPTHGQIQWILKPSKNLRQKHENASGRVPKQLNIDEVAALFPYPNRCLQNRVSIFTYSINSLQNDFDRIRASKRESWSGMTGPGIPLLYFIFKLSGRMPVFIHHMILGGGCPSLMKSNFAMSMVRRMFWRSGLVLLNLIT
ncbi:unnamed protein product [Orchesella dallaii]|uniref:Uncharacterized protein n=1 Tax=Orchesella dallaii TaxID=48710 RepID=A0ABP1RY89_9HEXA